MSFDRKEYARQWRESNKEKSREYSRRWAQKNKEKIKEKRRKASPEERAREVERKKAWAKANPEKCKEYRARYKEKHADRIAAQTAAGKDRWRRMRKAKLYGLTCEQVEQLEQQTHCPICGSEFTKERKSQRCFDHCHSTGKFRGVICIRCNTALGMMNDNTQALRNAITYLELVD